MARLADSRGRRQSTPDADHVRSGGRAMAAGIDRPLASRLREFFAGAHRQWRIRSAAARRLRRGCRCHVSGAQGGHAAIRTRPSVAAGRDGISCNGLAAAGRRYLGGARRAAALRPFEGDGLGRVRSRGKRGGTREFAIGQRWREIADEIHAEVCEKGFDRELNSFVQAYGSKRLDASLLLIPLVGFFPRRSAGPGNASGDRGQTSDRRRIRSAVRNRKPRRRLARR